MDLWIRSQDRMNLVKVRQVSLNYQNNKEIIANYMPDFYENSGAYCESLGFYTSKEKAIKVLDEIQDLLQNAYTGNANRIVYQMPKDE